MHPQVSVLLSHHLPQNRKYLDLAIKGVLQSKFVDLELLIGSSYKLENLPEDPRIKIIQGDDLSNCTKKFEAGINQIHPKSTHILLLSDDVYISNTLIINQLNISLQEPQNGGFILNPLSNGEIGSRFLMKLELKSDEDPNKKILLRPNIEYEDLIGFHKSAAQPDFNYEIIVPCEWASFYCTFLSRNVREKVGSLDPDLDIRHNDQDYCYRAKKLNIHTLVNLNAFCIHFGSKTLKVCHTQAEMDAVSDIFCKKLGGVRVLV